MHESQFFKFLPLNEHLIYFSPKLFEMSSYMKHWYLQISQPLSQYCCWAPGQGRDPEADALPVHSDLPLFYVYFILQLDLMTQPFWNNRVWRVCPTRCLSLREFPF